MTDILPDNLDGLERPEIAQPDPLTEASEAMAAYLEAFKQGQVKAGETRMIAQFCALDNPELDAGIMALFDTTHDQLDPVSSMPGVRVDRVTRVPLVSDRTNLTALVQRSVVDTRTPEDRPEDEEGKRLAMGDMPEVFITYSILTVETGEVAYGRELMAKLCARIGANATSGFSELHQDAPDLHG